MNNKTVFSLLCEHETCSDVFAIQIHQDSPRYKVPGTEVQCIMVDGQRVLLIGKSLALHTLLKELHKTFPDITYMDKQETYRQTGKRNDR